MQTGSPEIRSLGFEISNSVTVLGLKINSDSLDFQESWDKILQKVSNIIRHWSRFNLSLTGRINIAKTMLYSQINYLGCFLPVPDQITNSFEELIENFITGNLQISKKRLYLSPESGVLGLFELKTFLTSQKVAWTVRALNLDEIWKVKMYLYGNVDILQYKRSSINESVTPILYNFAVAFEEFLCGYTTHKENFWECPVFENRALFLRLRDKTLLSKNFFENLFGWPIGKKSLNSQYRIFF